MEEGGEGTDYEEQQVARTNAMRQRKPSGAPRNGETVYHGYCNVRIHELAQPKRWLLLYTYKDYRQYFETERAQAVKEKVQEMFGMTPEEAELYFNTMRLKKPKKVDLKALRLKIRRERKEARREALRIFHTVLRKAMKYAYRHAPPLLVTPMLRIVSDHMLELLADLHGVDLPKRTNTDNLSQLLISIADWCALFVSNIYYELEVEDRKEQQLRMQSAALPETDSSVTTDMQEKKRTDRKDEKQTKLTDYSEGADEEDDNDGDWAVLNAAPEAEQAE